MDTFEYVCDYCGKRYQPRRRYVQRFCSTSCRVGSHNRAKKLAGLNADQLLPPDKKEKEQKNITITGIAEASIGSLAAEVIKSIWIKPEDKPMTRGDGKILIEKIDRLEKLNKPLNSPPGIAQFPKLTSPIKKKEDDEDFGEIWV